MGGRDHSCEVCGRGGFNDPDGSCVCPVDPALEERVARALCRLENERHAENVRRSLVRRDMKPTVLRYEEDKEEWDEEARAALAALTTEDLLSLLQARSDEVVVELTTEECAAAVKADKVLTPFDDLSTEEWCALERFWKKVDARAKLRRRLG